MTEKQIEQQEKLLEDQLTLMVWYENDFREKLGYGGYQNLIDTILDKKLNLRKLKRTLYGK
jgi:hypothetical protein